MSNYDDMLERIRQAAAERRLMGDGAAASMDGHEALDSIGLEDDGQESLGGDLSKLSDEELDRLISARSTEALQENPEMARGMQRRSEYFTMKDKEARARERERIDRENRARANAGIRDMASGGSYLGTMENRIIAAVQDERSKDSELRKIRRDFGEQLVKWRKSDEYKKLGREEKRKIDEWGTGLLNAITDAEQIRRDRPNDLTLWQETWRAYQRYGIEADAALAGFARLVTGDKVGKDTAEAFGSLVNEPEYAMSQKAMEGWNLNRVAVIGTEGTLSMVESMAGAIAGEAFASGVGKVLGNAGRAARAMTVASKVLPTVGWALPMTVKTGGQSFNDSMKYWESREGVSDSEKYWRSAGQAATDAAIEFLSEEVSYLGGLGASKVLARFGKAKQPIERMTIKAVKDSLFKKAASVGADSLTSFFEEWGEEQFSNWGQEFSQMLWRGDSELRKAWRQAGLQGVGDWVSERVLEDAVGVFSTLLLGAYHGARQSKWEGVQDWYSRPGQVLDDYNIKDGQTGVYTASAVQAILEGKEENVQSSIDWLKSQNTEEASTALKIIDHIRSSAKRFGAAGVLEDSRDASREDGCVDVVEFDKEGGGKGYLVMIGKGADVSSVCYADTAEQAAFLQEMALSNATGTLSPCLVRIETGGDDVYAIKRHNGGFAVYSSDGVLLFDDRHQQAIGIGDFWRNHKGVPVMVVSPMVQLPAVKKGESTSKASGDVVSDVEGTSDADVRPVEKPVDKAKADHDAAKMKPIVDAVDAAKDGMRKELENEIQELEEKRAEKGLSEDEQKKLDSLHDALADLDNPNPPVDDDGASEDESPENPEPQPVEPVKPAEEPVKPVEPAEPAEESKPVESAEPAAESKPVEPVKPAEKSKPVEPAEETTEKPAENEASKPTSEPQPQPTEAAKPTEGAKPQPTETAKPAEEPKPQSTEAAKPAEESSPEEAYAGNRLAEQEEEEADIVRRMGDRVAQKYIDLANDLTSTAAEKRRLLNKYANEDGISVKTAEEIVESQVVAVMRNIASNEEKGLEQKWNEVKNLYEHQPNFSTRTSTSMMNQAYSTPVPISFVGGMRIGGDDFSTVYEPTAGTGSLVAVAQAKGAKVHANELAHVRTAILERFGGTGQVSQGDALARKNDEPVDIVMTNPPFANAKPMKFGVFTLTKLDHQIAAHALNDLKPDGRALVIVGANMDRKDGKPTYADHVFMNFLHTNFNVVDNYVIDGSLYRKQGASFPIRLLTINGRRKASEGMVESPTEIRTLKTFDEVFEALKEELPHVQGKSAERLSDYVYSEGREGALSSNNDGRNGQTAENSGGVSSGSGESVQGSGPRGDGRADGREVGNSDSSGGDRTGSGELGGVRSVDGGIRNSADDTAPVQRDGEGMVREPQSDGTEGGLGLGTVPARPDGENGEGGDSRGVGASLGGVESPANTIKVGHKVGDKYNSYISASKSNSIGTVVNGNLAEATSIALNDLVDEVGDVDEYVRKELDYRSKDELYKGLAAEQIDGVALAVRQLSQNNGFLIGDVTGLGKGRQAAAIIRWAQKHGKLPIFFTENAPLFSSMFFDGRDIGSDFKPLLMGDQKEGKIVERDSGKVLFAPPSDSTRMASALKDMAEGKGDFDCLFTCYSQFGKEDNGAKQRAFWDVLRKRDVVFVLDEAHNAAGDSNRGRTVQSMIAGKPVLYSSATAIKRADNLSVYYRLKAFGGQPNENLVDILKDGGPVLMQLFTQKLVSDGSYVRREKDLSDIKFEMKTVTPSNFEKVKSDADKLANAFRGILKFTEMAKAVLREQRKYESLSHGASSMTYNGFGAVLHNFVSQYLLAAKIDSVVDEAIASMKRGEKVVIALTNTMESVINDFAEALDMSNGDLVTQNFADVIRRYVSGPKGDGAGAMLRASMKSRTGDKSVMVQLTPQDLELEAQYQTLVEGLDVVLDGVEFALSPIDMIEAKIRQAGYDVDEITKRERVVNYDLKNGSATLAKRVIPPRNEVISKFNNGGVDCVILNASGSTGISLHASEKVKDQRPRRMLVVQPSLDINTVVQTLGRINRTGQVTKPFFTFVATPLTAEVRPNVVLAKKMRSLGAATSGDQKSDVDLGVDFINDYGDDVAAEWLVQNASLRKTMGLEEPMEVKGKVVGDANLMAKLTGRTVLFDDATQKAIFDELGENYNEKIDELKRLGKYTLDVNEYDDWNAVLKSSERISDDVEVRHLEVDDKVDIPSAKKVLSDFESGIGSREEAQKKLNGIVREMRQMIADSSKKLSEVATTIEQQEWLVAEENNVNGLVKFVTGLISVFGEGESRSIKPRLMQMRIGDETLPVALVGAKAKIVNQKHPGNLGQVKLKFAVAGTLQRITVPASRLTMKSYWQDLSDEFEIKPMEKEIETAFTGERKTVRAERYVFTGDLIKGYSMSGDGAQIVAKYRYKDGREEIGVIQPKKWTTAKMQHDPRLDLNDVDAVKSYLSEGGNGASAYTQDGVLQIRNRYDQQILMVPASARAGGRRYSADEEVAAITGNWQRGRVGKVQYMYVFVDSGQLDRLLKLLFDKGITFRKPNGAEASRNNYRIDDEDAGDVESDNLPEVTRVFSSEGDFARKILDERKCYLCNGDAPVELVRVETDGHLRTSAAESLLLKVSKDNKSRNVRNLATGITGVIERDTAKKMRSGKAVKQSTVPPYVHAAAMANASELFAHATLGVVRPNIKKEKKDEPLRGILRFHVVMEYEGNPYAVQFTVKKRMDDVSALYSVELHDMEVTEMPKALDANTSALGGGARIHSRESLPSKYYFNSFIRIFNLENEINAVFDSFNRENSGLSSDAVKRLSERLGFQGVEIVSNDEELPYNVREDVYSDRINGHLKGAWKGIYRDGVCYINAPAHVDERDAVVSILHEAAVHKGLRCLFENEGELNSFLDKCYGGFMQIKQAADNKMDAGLGRYRAIEEAIADFADNERYKPIYKKIYDWLKAVIAKLLKSLGLRHGLPSDVELRDILKQAEQAAREREPYDRHSPGSNIYASSSEVERRFPGWRDNMTTSEGGHKTQIAGTVATYGKIGEHLLQEGFNGRILDASSGKGIGTAALREMGFEVDDVEPYPAGGYNPNYISYDDVKGQYGLVISNAVLNVVEDDVRDKLLKQMAGLVAPGGRLFINVRPARAIETQIKNKVELDSPSEVMVLDNHGKPQSYQKGFTAAELKDYVSSMLGEDFSVVQATAANIGTGGGVAVVATKAGNPPVSAAHFGKVYYRMSLSASRQAALEGLGEWLNTAKDWGKRLLAWGESRGGVRPFVNKIMTAAKGELAAEREAVRVVMKEINDASEAIKNEKWVAEVREDMDNLLVGKIAPAAVRHSSEPRVQTLTAAVMRGRKLLDGLSLRIVSEMGDLLPQVTGLAIQRNVGSYTIRAYEKFINPKYRPSQDVVDNAKAAIESGFLARFNALSAHINNTNYVQVAKRRLMLDYLVTRDDRLLLGQSAQFERKARAFSVLIDRTMELCNDAIESTIAPGDNLAFNVDSMVLAGTVQGTVDMLLAKDVSDGDGFMGDRASAKWKIIRDSFLHRKDLPDWLRDLYGEITDYGAGVALTANRAVRVLTMNQMYRQLLDYNMSLPIGAKERVFYDAPYSDANKVCNVRLSGFGYGVLRDKYTDRNTYKMLSGYSSANKLPMVIRKAIGALRMLKTVLNIPTHPRNVIGNFGFIMNDAEALRNPKAYLGAIDRACKVLYGEGAAALAERQKLMRLGIIGSGAHAEEYSRTMKELFENNATGILNHWFLSKLIKKPIEIAEAAYAFEDNVFRTAAYYAKRARGIDAQDAAKEVSDLYPTYDRAPVIVDVMRKTNPIAPDFMSFRFEAMRCMVNALQRAFRSARKGDFWPAAGVLTTMGMATSISSLGISRLLALMSSLFDDDDDFKDKKMTHDELNSMRLLLPEYRENNLVWAWKDNGEIKYVDAEYIYPIEQLTLLAALATSKRPVAERVKSLVGYVTESYVVGGMMPESIAEQMLNTRDGNGKIAGDYDGFLEGLKKRGLRFASAFLPSMATYGARAVQVGLLNDDAIVDANGEVRTFSGELTKMVTPMRVYHLDVEAAYIRKMRKMSTEVKETRWNASRMVRRWQRGEASKKEAQEAVESARKRLESSLLMQSIYDTDKAGQSLGLSPSRRKELLREGGFTIEDANHILQGAPLEYKLPYD